LQGDDEATIAKIRAIVVDANTKSQRDQAGMESRCYREMARLQQYERGKMEHRRLTTRLDVEGRAKILANRNMGQGGHDESMINHQGRIQREAKRT
jgi:hypothetical protein